MTVLGPSTIEVLQGLVGQALAQVQQTPNGIMLTFSDGTVLWWRQ